MKKIIVCLLLVVCLFGCNKEDVHLDDEKVFSYDGQIAPYLHRMTFDDYVVEDDFDNNVAYGACSVVRNGNYIGRNYDYTYNDLPEFVTYVKAKQGRYASLSIACDFSIHEKDLIDGKISDDALSKIPNFTLDGINEKGVYCSINVVALETDATGGTNPNGEPLYVWCVPRFVLDNAGSADEAIELLKNRNIIGATSSDVIYYHFFVADKEKSYIVEIIDNSLSVKQYEGNEQILTNYYRNIDHLTKHASGIERYQILKDNYEEGNSIKGMQKLLYRVKFSDVYNKEQNPYRLSDSGFSQEEITTGFSNEKLNDFYSKASERYNIIISNDLRDLPDSDSIWITISNSTYDLENKTLNLYVQENYNHEFVFGLND